MRKGEAEAVEEQGDRPLTVTKGSWQSETVGPQYLPTAVRHTVGV